MTLHPTIETAMPLPASRVVGCWMTGLALALRCKLGQADDLGMGRAAAMARSALAENDPLRVEIEALRRQWPHLRRPHQAEALIAAGEKLLRAVERSSWPSQPARADIDG